MCPRPNHSASAVSVTTYFASPTRFTVQGSGLDTQSWANDPELHRATVVEVRVAFRELNARANTHAGGQRVRRSPAAHQRAPRASRAGVVKPVRAARDEVVQLRDRREVGIREALVDLRRARRVVGRGEERVVGAHAAHGSSASNAASVKLPWKDCMVRHAGTAPGAVKPCSKPGPSDGAR